MSDWTATTTCPDCHATIRIPITATRGHIADQHGRPVTSLRLTTSIGAARVPPARPDPRRVRCD